MWMTCGCNAICCEYCNIIWSVAGTKVLQKIMSHFKLQEQRSALGSNGCWLKVISSGGYLLGQGLGDVISFPPEHFRQFSRDPSHLDRGALPCTPISLSSHDALPLSIQAVQTRPSFPTLLQDTKAPGCATTRPSVLALRGWSCSHPGCVLVLLGSSRGCITGLHITDQD